MLRLIKYIGLSLILLFPLVSNAQIKSDRLTGKYRNNFGSQIELKNDSTFNYFWHFDLMTSWSNGTWSLKNDTIFIKTTLVYDTLRYKNSNGNIVDSLLLADDEKPKLISNPNISTLLSSGGQNRHPCPDKLFYENEKLFGITKKGKLVKRKVRGFWTKKEWDPWYFKQNEDR